MRYPLPPPGAAAYFEREAARCDTVKTDAAGKVPPDGASLEAVQAAARWSAAGWRYEAAFAQVVTDSSWCNKFMVHPIYP